MLTRVVVDQKLEKLYLGSLTPRYCEDRWYCELAARTRRLSLPTTERDLENRATATLQRLPLLCNDFPVSRCESEIVMIGLPLFTNVAVQSLVLLPPLATTTKSKFVAAIFLKYKAERGRRCLPIPS